MDARYYRVALMYAKRRDLSGAVKYARHALRINAQNEQAHKLLELCLYELGEVFVPDVENSGGFAHAQALLQRGKWRKAARVLKEIPHQSVRVLNAQGCLYASVKRYTEAEKFFVKSLEKDRGNLLASDCLVEVVKRRKCIWRLP